MGFHPTPKRYAASSACLSGCRPLWRARARRRPVHSVARQPSVLTVIRKSHARAFREALQMVPRHRKGKLFAAPLPDLMVWARQHPEAQRVSPGTVNKQLGAVQAIGAWGNDNGIVPDDTPWADPFQKMRVEEEQSERAPLVLSELQKIFDGRPVHSAPVARGSARRRGYPLWCVPTA